MIDGWDQRLRTITMVTNVRAGLWYIRATLKENAQLIYRVEISNCAINNKQLPTDHISTTS